MMRFLTVCLALAVLPATALFVVCRSGSDEPTGVDENLPRLPAVDMPASVQMREDDVILSFEPSEQERSATVYRTAPERDADEQYAESIANKFGVIGKPQKDNVSGGYDVESEIGSVSVPAQNGFSFARAATQQGSARTLGEDELRREAEAFLSERDLLPANARFSFADLQRRDVYFENIQVSPGIGGPSIVVGFDEAGTVARVGYDWPDLEPVGDYPLVTEEEAFEHIFRGGVFVVFKHLPVEVDSVQVFFYEERAEDNKSVYVPFYRFKGPDDQHIWVPALPDEYIMPQED